MTNISQFSSNSHSNHNDYTKEPENHLDVNESKWFAIYTNYKREKIVAKELENQGITAYLPLQQLVRQYQRKRKVVELPLINCYVFVHINQSEYRSVLQTEHVLSFIKFNKSIISIPNREIDLLKRLLGDECTISIEDQHFEEGETVEIVTSSLVGIKGKLVEKRGKQEMIIELEHIGYNFRISVPPEALIRVAKPI